MDAPRTAGEKTWRECPIFPQFKFLLLAGVESDWDGLARQLYHVHCLAQNSSPYILIKFRLCLAKMLTFHAGLVNRGFIRNIVRGIKNKLRIPR